MPSLDSANIVVELISSVQDILVIGPILSGAARSAHIVTPSSTVKGIFNMSAIAVADVWRDNESRRSADTDDQITVAISGSQARQ